MTIDEAIEQLNIIGFKEARSTSKNGELVLKLIEWLEELKTLRVEKEHWDDQIVNLSKNVESAYKQRDKLVAEKKRVIVELEERYIGLHKNYSYTQRKRYKHYCDAYREAIATVKGGGENE